MWLLPKEGEEGYARQATKHLIGYSVLLEKRGEQRNRDKNGRD